LPTLAKYEKAGIPSVYIIFPDQDECWKQACKLNGIPQMRCVHESRTVPGEPDVERMIPLLIDALTRPLTDEEKKRSRWEMPDKRILFEGTLEEAQDFYQQTEIIPQLENTPHALYTDGLPVIVPTEERVREMLKGTSHKPNELIIAREDYAPGDRSVQMGNSGKKGQPVYYLPMRRTATVEKVAAIAVMAGCRPEFLPAVLAIAESGGGCGDGRGGMGFVISGPYAREIKMNLGTNVLGPGNPANKSIGRAAELMWRNFGGEIPSVNNCGVFGNGLANCFAENAEALPPGWEGLNEECGYKKNESVIVPIMAYTGGMQSGAWMPGGYREFQKSGHGGIARRIGVKGIPGPHNILDYIKSFWVDAEGGMTFIMLPEMARHLYEYGFKTKAAVYEYIYKRSFMPLSEYRTHQRPDIMTNAWKGIERTSGKHWKELPDDYLVPACPDPEANCIIVTGNGEEQLHWMGGRRGSAEAYNIDAWR
jgi:hypothetical protein